MEMKKVLASALVGAMAFGLFGCGGGNGSSETGKSKEEGQAESNQLKIGMECGYAPFNWLQQDDSNGAVAIEGGGGYANGYDVQIAKLIAEDMGKDLVIVKTDWTGLIPSVDSGIIDGIIAGMSPTDERKKSIDFSDNYYKSDLVMVVRADGPYADATSIQDFSGAKITGQLNTFHNTVVDQIKGVNHVEAMEDFPAMRVALESGIIDGYVSERPEGLSASAANPKFAFVEFADGQGFDYKPDDAALAVGLKKGSALAAPINAAISKISEEDRQRLMNEAIQNQPSAEIDTNDNQASAE